MDIPKVEIKPIPDSAIRTPEIVPIKGLEIEPLRVLPTTNVLKDAPKPIVNTIKQPVIDSPESLIPSYEPITVPPNLEMVPAQGGSSQEKESTEDTEKSRELPNPGVSNPEIPRAEIQIPGTEIVVPLPTQKEVTLAGTTAVASTAAALIGKSLVERLIKIMKPLAQRMWLKAKDALNKDMTPYETQLFFSYEGTEGLKKLERRFRKEQKAERARQAEAFAELEHQRKLWSKGNRDERKSPSEEPLHNESSEQARNPNEPYRPPLADE